MQPDNARQRRGPISPVERSENQIRHMHDIFSDPHRCALLYYLQERDEPASVREAARQVLSWCRDEMEAEEGKVADRARAWLLQSHVLSMEEFGLIAYDPERDTIRLPEDVSVDIASRWKEPHDR